MLMFQLLSRIPLEQRAYSTHQHWILFLDHCETPYYWCLSTLWLLDQAGSKVK